MKFAPLHITSGYSFLRSGLTIDKIVKAMKDNDYFAMGLTDSTGLYGVPEFVNALEGLKKKYLIGLDVLIEGDYDKTLLHSANHDLIKFEIGLKIIEAI